MRCQQNHTWSSSELKCPMCGGPPIQADDHTLADSSVPNADSRQADPLQDTIDTVDQAIPDAPSARTDATIDITVSTPDVTLDSDVPPAPVLPTDATIDSVEISKAIRSDATVDSVEISKAVRSDATIDSVEVSKAVRSDATIDSVEVSRPIQSDATVDSVAGPPGTKAAGDTPATENRAPGLRTDHRAVARSPKSIARPQAVPGYEILEVLGRGAMGVVYKAKQIKLNRVVALKMILSGGHASELELRRFQAEAHAVAKMQHPNILQIYEVGEHNGCPYFSLEFVDGGTLQGKLEKNPLPPRDAATLIEVLARALHYAHQKGILHRDIKPANILLDADGTPKIADFGLAKTLDRNESLAPSNSVVGTPVYMPPEQALGKDDIGATADIYSLGATLYEMLVGRVPFRGSSVLDTLRQVREIEPVPPRQLQPSVPKDLQTICLKCLEKEPGKRYATALEFADDLRHYLDDKPIQARPATTFERVWKWSKRNRASAALIVVSVLALVGLSIGGFVVASMERSRADKELALRAEADLQRKQADEQRDEAQRQKKEADIQRAEADKQREQATKRGEEALQNFQRAQNAVEVLVSIAQQRMVGEKHLDTVGKELLERALVFYDQFLQQKPSDPIMKLQVARAHHTAGTLREKLARYSQAQQAFQTSAELYQSLLKDDPQHAAAHRTRLAEVLVNQATVLEVLKRPKEADAAFQEAIDLLDNVGDAKTSDPVSESVLAAACNNRGVLLHQRRHFDEAEKAYLKGITLLTNLAAKNPKELSHVLELAKTQANLGFLWTMPAPGEPDKAGKYYAQALARLTPLAAEHPDVPGYRKELGRVYLNRGALHANQSRFAEAQKDCKQAIEVFEELSRAHPAVADYRQLTATAYSNLGDLSKRNGEFPAAIEAFTQSRKLLEKLVKDEPEIAGYQVDCASALSALAQTYELEVRQRTKNGADLKDTAIDTPIDKATQAYQEAHALWSKLKDPRFALQIVSSYEGQCEFHKFVAGLLRKRSPEKAETHLEARLALRKELVDLVPMSPEFKGQWAEALLTIALLRGEMKKHAAAATDIDALSRGAPADWPLRHLGAAVLAMCLQAVVSDEKADPEQTKKLAQDYGQRALAILERSLASGWKDIPFLTTHPLLEPLRTHPATQDAYQALVRKAKAK